MNSIIVNYNQPLSVHETCRFINTAKIMATEFMPSKRAAEASSQGQMAPLFEGFRLSPGVKPDVFKNLKEQFAVRHDDVFVVASPKCGTTWTQQIVKLVRNNGVDDGQESHVAVPWLEQMTVDEAEAMESPRSFFSHLPCQMMPGGDPNTTPAKYIYVYRNPKDHSVSLYHMFCALWDKKIPFENFIEMMYFKDDKIDYFINLLGWWEKRGASNLLILSYEEMKRDLKTVVSRIATFLGYNLSDEVVKMIVEQTTFGKMKENPSANQSWMNEFVKDKSFKFMRKGVIGDWRNYFTDELSARMDTLIAEKLGSTAIVFDYGDN